MPEAAILSVDLPNEEATIRLGEDLALALKPGDCLALSGDLGAGKSTLARALIRAVAGVPDLEVPSPTFTLVQRYDLRVPVFHFDLYRLASPDDLAELGLDEALETGIALVEWPERAGERMPENAVTFAIEDHGEGRRASINGTGPVVGRIRRSLAIRAFLDRSGRQGARRGHLLGDASSRAYETIRMDGSEGRDILMNAPRQPDGPAIRDGKPYSRIAHLAEDVAAFVAIDSHLVSLGFAAPRIHAQDLQAGILLIEDLGTGSVLDETGKPVPTRYEAAIDMLAAFHEHPVPETIALAGGGHYAIPAYDRAAILIETELLLDWYLPYRDGKPADERLRAAYLGHWNRLVDRLAHAEAGLVLRDFHSPNIIWRGEREGNDRVGLIDFQDAVRGPAAYDVASLVQDARVTIGEDLQHALLSRYLAARAGDASFDAEAFREAFAVMAAQRASKILGIFVRLDRRDGKPGYLRHLPRIERYLAEALRHPVLHPLRDFLKDARILSGES